MAAAKVADMFCDVAGICPVSVGLELSAAGESVSTCTAAVVAADADAGRETRDSRKIGCGKCGESVDVASMGGEKSAQCVAALDKFTSECRQLVLPSALLVADVAAAASVTDGLWRGGGLGVVGFSVMKNPAFHLKIFREVVSSCERRGLMMSPLLVLYAVHMLEGHLCTFGAGHRSHCNFDLFMSRSMMRLGFTFFEPKELE